MFYVNNDAFGKLSWTSDSSFFPQQYIVILLTQLRL